MITEQEAWKIVRRFRDSVEPDERDTVYELVEIIDHMMVEQEMAEKKEQKAEQADEEELESEEPVITYDRKCNKCGKLFSSENSKARTCPDCKKKAQQEATARYEAKKKAKREEMQKTEQVAKEIVRLGEADA